MQANHRLERLAPVLMLLVLPALTNHACSPSAPESREPSGVARKADRLPYPDPVPFRETWQAIGDAAQHTPAAAAPPAAALTLAESTVALRTAKGPGRGGFCERFGLHKVTVHGGRSWRCRH